MFEPDRSVLRELQRVREQVLEHLLQPLDVGVDRFGDSVGSTSIAEVEAFAFRHVAERSYAVVLQFREPDAAEFDVHLARLDLAAGRECR